MTDLHNDRLIWPYITGNELNCHVLADFPLLSLASLTSHYPLPYMTINLLERFPLFQAFVTSPSLFHCLPILYLL